LHLSFLFAAFAVVWAGVLAYVLSLAKRNRELEADLEDLRAMIEDRSKRQSDSA